mmetsp:Transcript_24473/g.42825  ORF Transcript_24473/g.42825 Transcript_24473/m.42825 type:complete len:278 (+) Transcript_24473:42-875(+)
MRHGHVRCPMSATTVTETLLPKLPDGFDPESENDLRYPHWHKWISPETQVYLTYIIYAVYLGFMALEIICKQLEMGPGTPLCSVMYTLPLGLYVLATILLVGMVSKLPMGVKVGYVFNVWFFGFAIIWPRLLIPGLSGVLATFTIYALLYVIWWDGVVVWPKFGLPGYMSFMATGIGLMNMLTFKGWCYGYFPKFIYWNLFAWLQMLVTYKEYKQGVQKKNEIQKIFDYQVSIPVFKRLIPFRAAVMTFTFFAITYVQELLLSLLKEDIWVCTPMSW